MRLDSGSVRLLRGIASVGVIVLGCVLAAAAGCAGDNEACTANGDCDDDEECGFDPDSTCRAEGTCRKHAASETCLGASQLACRCDGRAEYVISCKGYSVVPIRNRGGCATDGAECSPANNDCASDELCLYPIDETCSSKSRCVKKSTSTSLAVIEACACDGTPASVSDSLPAGFAESSVRSMGPCPQTEAGTTDAARDASADGD